MTITKTNGAMTQANSGWSYTSTATYIPIGGMVHQQPDGLRSGEEYGYLFNWRLYAADEGGTSFVRTAELNIDNNQVIDEQDISGDTGKDAWIAASESGDKNNGIPDMNVPVNKQYEFNTWKGFVRSFYTGTSGATVVPPRFMAIQAIEDPDAASTDTFEDTGLHSATPGTYDWTPFSSNESCSAYTTRRLAGENTITINGRSARGLTTPLVNEWSVIPS